MAHARNTAVYPPQRRVAADIPVAREDFLDMAAVLEKHMDGRQFIVGDRVAVADFIVAYTLDMATMVRPHGHEVQLLDGFPRLRAYLERMY